MKPTAKNITNVQTIEHLEYTEIWRKNDGTNQIGITMGKPT